MKATLLYLLLSLYLYPAVAQNLVRNPSLEEIKGGIIGFKGISGTPDIASVESKVIMYPPYFNAYLSRTPSRHVTNIAFGEICLCQWFGTDVSELTQVELTRPLQKNKEYVVSLYTIRASSIEPPVNEITAHFINKPLRSTRQVYGLKDHPLTGAAIPYLSLQSTPPKPLASREVWTKVSAVYKAKGGERFLVLGNFTGANADALEAMNPEWQENEVQPGGKIKGTYYCYDNISVMLRPAAEKQKVDPVAVAVGSADKSADSEAAKGFKVGKTITLSDVNFTTGDHHIMAIAYPMLDSLVAFMTAAQEAEVYIHGHTDDVGNDEDNMSLSVRRAQAVKEYLTNSGVAAGRISIRGFGESMPKVANDSDENRALNRRVEIEIGSR